MFKIGSLVKVSNYPNMIGYIENKFNEYNTFFYKIEFINDKSRSVNVDISLHMERIKNDNKKYKEALSKRWGIIIQKDSIKDKYNLDSDIYLYEEKELEIL